MSEWQRLQFLANACGMCFILSALEIGVYIGWEASVNDQRRELLSTCVVFLVYVYVDTIQWLLIDI